jgi:hypothetical protein
MRFLLLLMAGMPFVQGACELYCSNPCAQFADPQDTVDECSGCSNDGNNKCFPGASGYGGDAAPGGALSHEDPPTSTEAQSSVGKSYEGISEMPFDQLKDDKRMKMVVFHWSVICGLCLDGVFVFSNDGTVTNPPF